MNDARSAISVVPVILGLAVAAAVPLVLGFHWLDANVRQRWVRWLLVALLWALLLPAEGIAFFLLYEGLRPALVGTGLIEALDPLRQVWLLPVVQGAIILTFAVAIVRVAVYPFREAWWYRVKDPRTPFVLRDQIPPDLTYRRKQKKQPPSA